MSLSALPPHKPGIPSQPPREPGRRRRDEALVLALDATLTSIWDYSLTEGTVTLDENWARMCGREPAATVTRIEDLYALLHPDDLRLATRALLACVSGRTDDYGLEHRVHDEHGEWIWVLSRGRVTHRDAEGRALRMIGTNIDVTRRKTGELAALRESEARFQGVFDETPIPIVLLSLPDGRITEANKACAAIFGYERAEVIGKTTVDLGIWANPADRDHYLARLQAEGKVHGAETHMRTKHGVVITVLYNASVITLGGRPCLLSSVIDITAQKQAEAALRQSESQLRQAQKMESLGTLAGGIAHDFNNILTGILGHTQLAMGDLPDAHPIQSSLQGILQSGARARDLVQQILTFSRKTESERLPVKLPLVLMEALGLLRSTLPAMVRIEHAIDPACPPVLADSTQLHQVILNLCTNAWHALPGTGGLIEIGLGPRELTAGEAAGLPPLKAGPHVRLTVRDNGRGMSPATLERIFEPFFTTKDAGKGTGLGLAVVHSVVAAHGGAITVASEPGQGTCFEIHLPALAASAPTRVSAMPASAPRGRGESILVVDDEPASGTVISRLIDRLGYRATLCADPFQAIALLYTNDYALLVTDLAMPGLPGDDLAQQALARRPDLPVLLLSGFIEPDKLERLRGLGIREILGKPPSLEELAAAVERCLRG